MLLIAAMDTSKWTKRLQILPDLKSLSIYLKSPMINEKSTNQLTIYVGLSPSIINCARSHCVSLIWQPAWLSSPRRRKRDKQLSPIFWIWTAVPISTTICQYYILHLRAVENHLATRTPLTTTKKHPSTHQEYSSVLAKFCTAHIFLRRYKNLVLDVVLLACGNDYANSVIVHAKSIIFSSLHNKTH